MCLVARKVCLTLIWSHILNCACGNVIYIFCRRLPAKKRISNFLIAISWIVPVIFIAVSTLTWNCSSECRCPSSSFEGEVCPHDFRCSRMITPLSISFLLVNAALWGFEVRSLCFYYTMGAINLCFLSTQSSEIALAVGILQGFLEPRDGSLRRKRNLEIPGIL